MMKLSARSIRKRANLRAKISSISSSCFTYGGVRGGKGFTRTDCIGGG
jgi:single-stranded DNA-specific DHH superfamily exonuclease